MTRYDFSPLFRSTVGFDRIMNLLDTAAGWDPAASGNPPYDIEKLDENDYRITLAVAGFGEGDIQVEVHQNTLKVTAAARGDGEERDFLYRGIDGRGFTRSFQLADYLTVVGATLQDGMLRIDLHREIPDEMKPRRIEIGTGARVVARQASEDGGRAIPATGAPKTIAGKAKKLVDSVRSVA